MDATENPRKTLPALPGPSGRPVLRVHLNIRRIAALVPVGVLVVAALAAAQPLTPTATVQVPRRALEAQGGGNGQAMTFDPVGPLGPGGPLMAAPHGPGSGPGTSAVRLDRTGIPARALTAYRNAEQLLGRADPSCRVDWALVAAIGRVESRHGSFGGNALGSDGVARPGIIGIALDGSRGTARIPDTDGGALDRDTSFDRAVGPMQFIPGTWRAISQDGDGDGRRDPQDIDDAATATGAYLCAGPGDLTRSADAYRAVFRYNHSDDYARTVLAIADAYRRGVDTLPSGSLPAGELTGGSGSGGELLADGARPAPAPASAAPAPTSTRQPAPIVAGAQPAPGGGGSTGDGSTGTTAPPPPGGTDPVAGVVAGVVGAVGRAVGGVGGVLPGGGGGGGGSSSPAPAPSTCTTSPTQPLPPPLPPLPPPPLPLPSCSAPGLPLP